MPVGRRGPGRSKRGHAGRSRRNCASCCSCCSVAGTSDGSGATPRRPTAAATRPASRGVVGGHAAAVERPTNPEEGLGAPAMGACAARLPPTCATRTATAGHQAAARPKRRGRRPQGATSASGPRWRGPKTEEPGGRNWVRQPGSPTSAMTTRTTTAGRKSSRG